MTQLSDKKLGAVLDSYQAPAPGDLLKARILKAADETTARHKSFTKRYMPIAASLIAVCAVGFTALQVTGIGGQPEAEAWQEAALDLGFQDIYEWVETSGETAAP